jgi:hypothetical protein
VQPIPVLTYHAANVDSNDYGSNDHVAFASDLQLIDALGFRVVCLSDVVNALLVDSALPDRAVAVSFDDGTDLDYRDRVHPKQGVQRGMLNILRDFRAAERVARQPFLHATAFVIVSPDARDQLDKKCMLGEGWYGDDWWAPAVSSGLLGIANHSWDHNHHVISTNPQRSSTGNFLCIDSLALADMEIRSARQYIDSIASNESADLFAYPYGESNPFLIEEYFPLGPTRTGVRAAFNTTPSHVARGANRWLLPRYVCGAHWKSPEELRRILQQS